MGDVITELYAWVTVDDGDGNEGVLSVFMGGVWMPLVGADMERMTSLRPYVDNIRQGHPHPIELRRYTTMSVIESIPPDVLDKTPEAV